MIASSFSFGTLPDDLLAVATLIGSLGGFFTIILTHKQTTKTSEKVDEVKETVNGK